jgi:hypothetical protein
MGEAAAAGRPDLCQRCCRRPKTLAAAVVEERLPSVRRHAGDNFNGGEGEAARRKESSEAATREGRDGRQRRERRDWDAAAAREGEAARRKESSEAAVRRKESSEAAAREGRDGRRRRERRDWDAAAAREEGLGWGTRVGHRWVRGGGG